MKTQVGPYLIESTYVHLGPDGQSIPLPVTQKFWEDLATGQYAQLGAGRLVSQFHCSENWTTWEMHPQGEEMVCLLSGAADLVLSQDGVERSVPLKAPGTFLIVPRGVWHTANVLATSSLLFITPGEGTEHRPR